MPICKKCGVEFKDTTSCPLCGAAVGESSCPEEKDEARPQPISSVASITKIWFWELFTFFVVATLIVVFTVDFAYGMKVTWSRYPLLSITFLWLTVCLIIFLTRHISQLLLCETLILGLYLWFLDMFMSVRPWFFPFALPLLLVTSLLFWGTYTFVNKINVKVTGILISCMISLGIFLVCLEIILNRFITGKIFVSWSVVAFACILPLTGFLLLFQKKMQKNGSHLKKIFHV
ncbi:MAG: hypothetical protein JXB60_03580 [Candidatus Cloacimonetes bacterium]|nr:hypothetical protein [Candidatus Cloacimonadota bacterium]